MASAASSRSQSQRQSQDLDLNTAASVVEKQNEVCPETIDFDIDDDDVEEIFSLTRDQRTLNLEFQPLPQFTTNTEVENLKGAIDLIISKGKDNTIKYSKQMDQLWKSLANLEDRAKLLLKKRKRLRKRIQEIEDIRDVFEKDQDMLYEGMFDKKSHIGRFDIRSLSGDSRISALLASDAELSDFETISSKKSSFLVLKLENQIQGVNSQLRMMQDNLSFTEKGLEKVHLANRHSLVSLIKLFRSPADHNLSTQMELTPKDTLPHLAGFVANLLQLTRKNYKLDAFAVKNNYASCMMNRDDAVHTFVQIRNDTEIADNGYEDTLCLLAGQCMKLQVKRGLCFTSEKRELFSKDFKADLSIFKDKGFDLIVIFIEDLLDELPSEPKAVCDFLDELPKSIKLFTGED